MQGTRLNHSPGVTIVIPALLLMLLTLLVYWPATRYDFVNCDDPFFVYANTHVQGGLTFANVKWAFSSVVVGNWHPLTMLSYMLNCQWFGLAPWSYHLVNIILHALDTGLVFVLFWRLIGAVGPSFVVAAFFGLHPMHVESVAWVSERKDVLSAFFGLLSLICYVQYASAQKNQPPTAGPIRSLDYWLALIFFALGLLSKSVLVTLPCLLLLLDYWPFQRITPLAAKRLVLEKIPFFALALIFCVVTYFVEKHGGGGMATADELPLDLRLENAPVSYCRYIEKLFWPVNLAVQYPYPGQWPLANVVLASVVLATLSALIFTQRIRFPYLLVGWLWFCGMLVPVIGLVQVGTQSMADRHTYLSSLGLFLLVAFGLHDLAGRWRFPLAALGTAGAVVIILCAALTRQQLAYWQNNETLYRHALAVTEGNYFAHHNLGIALFNKGDVGGAIQEYQEALKIKPNNAKAHFDLGTAFGVTGQSDAAIAQFQTAITLKPGYADAHSNLGTALAGKGEIDQAIVEFQAAIDSDPDNPVYHYELGTGLGMRGQIDQAITQFQEALRLKPDFTAAQRNLAYALQIKKAAKAP